MNPWKSTVMLVALLATGVLRAQIHYVDGQIGSDVPTAGSAPAAPWKTISYALAQVTAPTTGSIELRIAGGQIYSNATNGETFPLALPPRVSIRSNSSSMASAPKLEPAAGQSAIILAAASTYPGDYLHCEGLSFGGGEYGIHCGADASHSHALSITRCDFRNQTGAGIHAESDGSSLALTVFECEFVGVGRVADGIEVRMLANGCDHQLEVAGSRFQGLETGVDCSTNSLQTTGGEAHCIIQRCDLENCTTGLMFRDPLSHPNTCTYEVSRTRVAACDTGIAAMESYNSGASGGTKSLEVDQCWIHSCVTGVRTGSTGGPDHENIELHLSDSAIANCTTGTYVCSAFQAYDRMWATNTLWSGNDNAITAHASSDGAGIQLDLRRCRLLNGTTGLSMNFIATADSHVRMEACVLAGFSADAITYGAFTGQLGYPSYATGYFRSLTLADNGRGLSITSLPHFYGAVNNAFSNNTTDLTGLATSDSSITDGPPLTGSNNTTAANLQILRPSYKPTPNSPCIDAGTGTLVADDYEGDARPAPGTAPDIGADEYHATGSSRSFGTPATGTAAHLPLIGPTGGNAQIGTAIPIDLTITPAPTSVAFAVLGVGYSELAPFELTQIAPGSMLWVEASALSQPMAIPASGAIGIHQTVPPIPGLIGLSFHAQWLVLLSGGHLATSNGLRITLGS